MEKWRIHFTVLIHAPQRRDAWLSEQCSTTGVARKGTNMNSDNTTRHYQSQRALEIPQTDSALIITRSETHRERERGRNKWKRALIYMQGGRLACKWED